MTDPADKPRFRRQPRKQPLWPLGLFALIVTAAVLIIFWPRPGRDPGQARPGIPPPAAQRETPPPAAAPATTEPEKSSESALAVEAPAVEQLPELLSQARQAVLAGDHNRAEQLYRTLADTDPGFVFEFGSFLYRRGKLKEAVPYLETARARIETPPFPVRKFLALAYYQLNQLQKCRELTQEALSLQLDGELRELAERLSRELRIDSKYGNIDNSKFQLLFNGREHADIKRTALDILNEAYRTIGQRLDHYPPGPVSVILYTETDFSTVTQAPGWAGGVFDGKIRLPVQGALDEIAELRRILFHEYSHALVYTLTPTCPLWVQEGLAEYFSQSQVPRVGQVFPLLMLERGFPSGSLIALLTAYQESHQAVADLITRFGMYRVKQFLQELGKGKSTEEAFAAIFFRPYQTYFETWGK